MTALSDALKKKQKKKKKPVDRKIVKQKKIVQAKEEFTESWKERIERIKSYKRKLAIEILSSILDKVDAHPEYDAIFILASLRVNLLKEYDSKHFKTLTWCIGYWTICLARYMEAEDNQNTFKLVDEWWKVHFKKA